MAPLLRSRRPSPVNPGKRALLETVREPLYDNAVIDQTTTGSVVFFGDPAGSGGKQSADTNMDKGGSLPHPRVFDIHKIGLYFSQAVAGGRTQTMPTAEGEFNAPAAFHNTMQTLAYTTHFQLRVGEKDYIRAPFFLLPGNAYFDGAVIGGNIAAAFANGLRVLFGQLVGMQFSIARRRVRLLPDMQFRAYLHLPHAASVLGIAAATQGHVISCVLDGLSYREVQ